MRMVAQLLLNASLLYSVLFRVFQVIVGTIASTRWSMAAVTNWMPPPYDTPAMPIRGSRPTSLSSWASGCVATQLMMAETSRASKSGELSSNTPPELYSPRGSHVTTL